MNDANSACAERTTQVPEKPAVLSFFVLVLELLVLFDFYGAEAGREEHKEQS